MNRGTREDLAPTLVLGAIGIVALALAAAFWTYVEAGAEALKVLGAWGVALASVGAVYYAVFVLRQASPNLRLQISASYLTSDASVVRIRFSVHNVSRVRVTRAATRLVVAEHPAATTRLSEWVPFSPEHVLAGENPSTLHAPIDVLCSTIYLNPDERIEVERLFELTTPGAVVHLALQFQSADLGWIRAKFLGWGERWTTTAILHPADAPLTPRP